MQQTTIINQNSSLLIENDDVAVEAFYKNKISRRLHDSSRACDEIFLFARRAAELLHERLPRLSRVPHRVDIVDQRESKENIDQRTLIRMQHKHRLSLILQRRQFTRKMMTQARKNQNKMEHLHIQVPLKVNSRLSCGEIAEQITKEEKFERPQTEFVSRRVSSKMTDNSSMAKTTESKSPSISSCSVPFQDTLSIYHAEKPNNARFVLPTRPFTAPVKKLTFNNYY